MKRVAVVAVLALATAGCNGVRVSDLPFNYGNYGGGPRQPVERGLRIADPRITPDGGAIIFAFRYKQYPWKVAVASTDPRDPKVSVLKLPPMINWLQPNFGSDPAHITIVSFCMREDCYKGAKGYNVWLASALPKNNLKRVTPDAPDVRRANPVFGAAPDDLYWFVSDSKTYPKVHSDVADRYLAHMVDGKEITVFPQLPVNGDWKTKRGPKDPGDLTIIDAHGAGRYDDQGYYFTGMTVGGTSSAAKAAADKVGKFRNALFRHTPNGFDLVEPVEVEYVDAPRGARGYVAMAHHFTKEHTNAVADFRAVRDGQTLWSYRFHSQAYGVSVSENLSTIVFSGERSYIDEKHIWHPRLQEAIYLWRQGMAEAVDLNIPERVKAAIEAEIAAEKQARISTPNSPSNLLTEHTVFAVDNGHFAVQD